METPQKPSTGNDYFSFKTMISLGIVRVIYLIGAIGTTLAGLYWLFTGANMGTTGRFIGLAILLLGNILWRVWCELLIIFFRINATLNIIEQNTRKAIQ